MVALGLRGLELPDGLVAPAALPELLRAAQAHEVPVSLMIGLGPKAGGVVRPQGVGPLDHLGERIGTEPWQDDRLYLGLWQGAALAPTLRRPINLALFDGDLNALAAATGFRFAAEVVSLGTHRVDDLPRADLLTLRSLLMPGASLSLYFFAAGHTRDLQRMGERLTRCGFAAFRADQVELTRPPRDQEALRPVPYALQPLKSCARAQLEETGELPSDREDPLAQVLLRFVPKNGHERRRLSLYVRELVVAWLRRDLRQPFRRRGDFHEIETFATTHLAPYPEVQDELPQIRDLARATLTGMAALFQADGPSDRVARRRPLVAGLAHEFFRVHTAPYAYRGFWSWISGITGMSGEALRDAHRDELLPLLLRHYEQFDQYGQTHLLRAYQKDPGRYHARDRGLARLATVGLGFAEIVAHCDAIFADGRRDVTWGNLVPALSARTGVARDSLEPQYRLAIRAALWRYFHRLAPGTRDRLKAELIADREAFREQGFEPPFEHDLSSEQNRRLKAAIAAFLQGRASQSPVTMIPARETLTALQTALAEHGIRLNPTIIRMRLFLVAGELWVAADQGVVDPRLLTSWQLARPEAKCPEAPGPADKPASARAAATSGRGERQQPKAATIRPLTRAESDRISAGLQAELGEFLARRGRGR